MKVYYHHKNRNNEKNNFDSICINDIILFWLLIKNNNFRVEHIEGFVEGLKKNGVTVADIIETYDYVKFVHILYVEGNKIELWEANDIGFEKSGKQFGSETAKQRIDKNAIPLTLHWQYGGATNIFSAFCSLLSVGFGRRITPSNRINNGLLYL